MSPASKSKNKLKDKASAKSPNEQPKASTKSPGSTNSASGTPASAYNPLSGTFHALEVQPASSSPTFHDSGRFRNIDDTDEHSSSPHGTLSEYDSVSNNGSCSGDSEDTKEKVGNCNRLEAVTVLDNDRREKIRLKNEKKHQRQRERRAQELHERCSGYLMSRKLEGLSQQLVVMGFSHERATLALMLNQGRLEESVNWLFEGSEEEAHNKDTRLGSGGNSKIDISEELAQISKIESKYKCSKQEVERAVVSCEGDLVKAEEMLRAQKPEPPAAQQISEETGGSKNLRSPQEKAAVASVTMLQRRDGRDLSYIKTPITASTNPEIGGRNLQPMNQPNTVADKRWTLPGSTLFPSSSTPSMQPTLPPVKSEVRLGVPGNDGKVTQQMVREPVVMMQRPQPINLKQNQHSSFTAAPSVSTGWYSTSVPVTDSVVRLNGKLLLNHSTGNVGMVNQNPEQFYRPASYKESPYFFNSPVDSPSTGLGGSWNTMGRSQHAVPSDLHCSYSPMGASLPTLTSPSSLGLFTGWGSGGTPLGSSSHVDWNTGGLVPEFDYTSIDWTLDANQSASRQNGLWLGISSLLRDSSGQRSSSTTNGSCIQGGLRRRDNGAVKETSSSAGAREWTSPFAGKDIFSAPRQFVTSPSP